MTGWGNGVGAAYREPWARRAAAQGWDRPQTHREPWNRRAAAQGWGYPTQKTPHYTGGAKTGWTAPVSAGTGLPTGLQAGGGGPATASTWGPAPSGGGGAAPAAPGWGGATGGYSWMPWQDWGAAPWATLDPSKSAEGMQWMNTVMPWLQLQQQGGQWGQEFGQRQASDLWNQQFQQGQFDWQRANDEWARQVQEQQLKQQQEQAYLNVYGRRFRPNTRWL